MSQGITLIRRGGKGKKSVKLLTLYLRIALNLVGHMTLSGTPLTISSEIHMRRSCDYMPVVSGVVTSVGSPGVALAMPLSFSSPDPVVPKSCDAVFPAVSLTHAFAPSPTASG